MIHLMAMSRSFVFCPAGWQQVRVMASSVMKRRKLSVRYREVLTVYLCEMQPLKRRRTVHTLNELKPVDKATVQIDRSIQFLRCTALAQRDNEDSTVYFAHGMTAVPTSLLREFFLRKVDQSNMRNIMSDYATQLTPYSMLVIDGRSLLRFMEGYKNAKHAEVLG